MMNLDAEIKAAQERMHRRIGQWARHAHAELTTKALRAYEEIDLVVMPSVRINWERSFSAPIVGMEFWKTAQDRLNERRTHALLNLASRRVLDSPGPKIKFRLLTKLKGLIPCSR